MLLTCGLVAFLFYNNCPWLSLFRKAHIALTHILRGGNCYAIFADSTIEVVNNALMLHYTWFMGIFRVAKISFDNPNLL
jgi:hypothetical protein